jgi:hypothetical protein
MTVICSCELHGVTTQTTALLKYMLLSTCILCLQTREDLGADEKEDLRNYTYELSPYHTESTPHLCCKTQPVNAV